MKKLILLFYILLFGIPGVVSGEQPESEPVVILYHDTGGTTNPNDIDTQNKPVRIVFHMIHVVLPNKYGINIKMTPIKWTRGLELIKAGLTEEDAETVFGWAPVGTTVAILDEEKERDN